jgi:hypothetical protein
LLAVLGLLLSVASRHSRALRRQISRDVVVEIGSRRGGEVAHHYVFTAGDRRCRSVPGRASLPTVALWFESPGFALACLASPWAVGMIVRACLARKAEVTGNPVLFLWFYGLTRVVLPVNRQTKLRRPLPGALLAPDRNRLAYSRVVREPAADTIDPTWAGGVRGQRKLAVVMGAAGEPLPMV